MKPNWHVRIVTMPIQHIDITQSHVKHIDGDSHFRHLFCKISLDFRIYQDAEVTDKRTTVTQIEIYRCLY